MSETQGDNVKYKLGYFANSFMKILQQLSFCNYFYFKSKKKVIILDLGRDFLINQLVENCSLLGAHMKTDRTCFCTRKFRYVIMKTDKRREKMKMLVSEILQNRARTINKTV